MKHRYGVLLSMVLVGLISLSGLAQIPNAGMENWNNGNPIDWLTDNIPTIPPVLPVTQSSDAHSGSSSAHLEILNSSFGPYPAELFSGSDGNGFPTTTRHAYVTGYYKFMPADALDVLQVYAQVWEGTNFLGAASYPITAAATTWTQFMAPINYSAPGTPDRCKVDFILSTGSGTVGGIALIDDLGFSGVNAIEVIDNGQIPNQFELGQNYPNPFNPTTNIEFSIPQTADVKLVVYNQLGQTVATLVNERLSANNYSVDWNAENLPSGIYFCRISAGDFSKTMKLMLMK
jgi:hypothetical protein